MLRETLHGFLKWLWPAFGASFVALAGIAVGAAEVWESAKNWVAARSLWLVGMAENPWVWLGGAAIFLAWLWAFVWSGHRQPIAPVSGLAQDGQASEPTSRLSVPPPVAVRAEYAHRMDSGAYHLDLRVTGLEPNYDVAVLVRYARVIHYLSRAEWKWTLSSRAAQRAHLLKGETLTVNVASRVQRPASDELRIFGEAIEPDDGNGGGTLVLTEVSIHAAKREALVCRRLYSFMAEPHGRGAHVLDQEAHGFIVDPDAQA